MEKELDFDCLEGKFSLSEIKYLENRFKGAEGQKYSCSNQVVICGFFASHRAWLDFLNHIDVDSIVRKSKNSILLKNGEYWYHFSPDNYNCRGFRFYKLWVTANIDRGIFLQHIYPYTTGYCSELKFLWEN